MTVRKVRLFFPLASLVNLLYAAFTVDSNEYHIKSLIRNLCSSCISFASLFFSSHNHIVSCTCMNFLLYFFLEKGSVRAQG